MHDAIELNTRFGIGIQLTFETSTSGQIIANINNELATASITLQGGHLMQWQPAGTEPVIWLSPDAILTAGKSIRGGVPICWPWFGAHESNADFPAHGFARTTNWNIISSASLPDGTTRITLELNPANIPAEQWPHPTSVNCEITVGDTLTVTLITRNSGAGAISISEALHTYFAISDIHEITIEGLDGCLYLDKVDGMKAKKQTGAITFASEVDRVYIDTEGDCVIRDPNMGRQIRIRKTGSRSTVVWNPWIDKAIQMGDMGKNGYLKMVCVESANAAKNSVYIPAGEEHRLTVNYSVERA